MTTEPTIICPKCKAEIKLTESLAAPLIASTRKHYEQQLTQKDKDIADREQHVRDKEKHLADEKASIDEVIAGKVSEQLKGERIKIIAEETKNAKLAAATDLEQKTKELSDLHEVLKQRDTKLAEAQKAQADLIRKQRELDDAKRELELTVEKRVQEGLGNIRMQARKEVEEEQGLKVAEKEQIIASMQKQIEELKRKSEQGSQQLQGEVQELEIEALLKATFPLDAVEPVPKGEYGGDTLQRVVSSLGQVCGTILWESKRTKNWTDTWLPKLRDDQRAAKAELSVLVSQTLPKEIDMFDFREGVWVIHPRVVIPVALMLRQSLIELAAVRKASEGQQGKMEMLYGYLTGPHFKQRFQTIVEAFTTMREELDRERKVMTAQWSKREKQIDRVMQSTVGMYGDLQGIAGKGMNVIEGLEMEALVAPASNQSNTAPIKETED